jgi:hypothetical protein
VGARVKSDGAPELQAAREGASGVGIGPFFVPLSQASESFPTVAEVS